MVRLDDPRYVSTLIEIDVDTPQLDLTWCFSPVNLEVIMLFQLLGLWELVERRYKAPYAVSTCLATGEVMTTWRGVEKHVAGSNDNERTNKNLGRDRR